MLGLIWYDWRHQKDPSFHSYTPKFLVNVLIGVDSLYLLFHRVILPPLLACFHYSAWWRGRPRLGLCCAKLRRGNTPGQRRLFSAAWLLTVLGMGAGGFLTVLVLSGGSSAGRGSGPAPGAAMPLRVPLIIAFLALRFLGVIVGFVAAKRTRHIYPLAGRRSSDDEPAGTNCCGICHYKVRRGGAMRLVPGLVVTVPGGGVGLVFDWLHG